MQSYYVDKIHAILERIMGKPKNGGYSNGWRSYNCPYCAEVNLDIPDGKYNMETNVEHGMAFHCWKCEAHGRLFKLIKDFGTYDDIEEYRNLLTFIKDDFYYDNSKSKNKLDFEYFIEIPNGFRKFNKNDSRCYDALTYLYKRNIGDDVIDKYGIGYIDNSEANDFSLRNRVIIPSYDAYGYLNYWIGRDYSGRNKIKYKNPEFPKTSIIFNERFINWYEDVTLVEGPFDHIVVPNSVPLLGKTLRAGSVLYKSLFDKAQANINILLDPDAIENAFTLYKQLNKKNLKNRVRLIKIHGDYDASLVYQNFGKSGIIELFKRACRIHDFDMQWNLY